MTLLWLHYGYVVAVAMAAASASRETAIWLLCQTGENKPVCSSHGSSNLLPASAGALPTLGSANSANSVNREITGVRYKISNTGGRVGTQLKQLSMQAQTSP